LAADVAGHEVLIITAVGDDAAGRRLSELLSAYASVVGIPMTGATPRKVRVRANGHTLVRIDQGDGRAAGAPLPAPAVDAFNRAGAVLVSDYGRGVAAHPQIRGLLAKLAETVPVTWDPHPNGPPPPSGVRLVTPNQAEARAFARTAVGHGACEPFSQAAADAAVLIDRWRATGVAVTLGEYGALLSMGEPAPYICLAERVSPDLRLDACGAGDCFAAVAAHVLHQGGMVTEAVTEAVRHAGAFVATGGAASAGMGACPGRNQRGGPEPGAMTTDADVWETVRRVREGGGRVVATGGCFDLLHAGHVSLLHGARRLGDCLVVCVNSDVSIRALKGSGRPLVPLPDRLCVLSALEGVDAVAVFDEPTPVTLLECLRPDVWVKGADYAGIDLAEAEVVRRNGGEVVLLPYLDGRSTSRLVVRARETATATSGGDDE
jgi:rfaE bifunctional protein nucleotidyltransferase chain/domain